jgi:hypothetical protein
MRIIELTGSHYEMGRQHAQQVEDLRPRILDALHHRLESLETYGTYLKPYIKELASAWNKLARPTLDSCGELLKV